MSHQRLKILVVASWYPTAESPVAGVFVHDQAHALAAAYDVAVIAPRLAPWRSVLRQGFGPRRSAADEDGVLTVRDEGLIPFPRCPEKLGLARLAHRFDASYRWLVQRWGRPDLVHAHVVLPGGYLAARLGSQEKIPVVITEHAGPFEQICARTAAQREFCRYAFGQCDQVVAVSPEMERQLHDFDPSLSVAIVPDLVRTNYFVPPQAKPRDELDGSVRFLLQAVLVERKGGRHLIEAARILQQRGRSDFQIVIGGDGLARRPWQQLAEGYGLGNCIEFPGLLSREQVLREMQQCDVFVLPSLHENFGIVSGEAMACGKPVLATRCGGSEFVVTPETGVLVPPADAVTLADAIETFLDGAHHFDPATIRASVVRRFGEEAFLAAMARLYEDVLQRTRGK